METVVQSIVGALSGKLSKEFIVFIVSMIPLLELRGSILAAGYEYAVFFNICRGGAGEYAAYTVYIAVYRKDICMDEKKPSSS